MTKRIDTPDSVLNHIREFACREARRRSMLTRGPVSIRVAGVDRAVIADSGSVHSLVLECGAPTVELVGRDLDGEVVIAVYLLTYDGPKTEVWKVTLPWGEEIVCRLQYRDDDRVFAEMELRSTSEIAIPAGATPEMGQLERVRNGFRFGPFILDRDTCELYRNGEFYKHLRQQACTVLIALLERSPALVKREELIALVWGSGTKEPEFGLANIIGDLRKDLEDSKDHPQYVQVLGGLGIRFNASVDKLPATSVASGETHAVLADSPEIQSQLFDEVLTYLAELARVAAELPPYCPPHPTSSPCSATGFDSIRQSVQLVEDRTAFEDLQTADWEQMRAAGLDLTGLVHKPWRARLEEEEEKKETRRRLQKRRGPPVMVWDEKAGEGFHRAVILGDPGFGKTWLLRYEARRLARQGWLALQQRTISLEQLVLPIFLRLPDLAWSTSGIENGLVSAVGQPHTERFRSWVREKLQTEHCVIFLDAWDEVPTEAPKEGRVVEQLGHRQHLGRRLESFAWRFPRPRLLMTSRLAGYVGSPVPGAKELELLAFEKGQQEAFVGVWFGEEKAKGEAFLQVLRQNRQVRALGRIPLMLALMCRAYQEGQLSIPTRRVEVYDCCLRGLLRDWLGEKQRREVSDAYVDAQLELLQAVAYDLFREGYEQFGEGLLRTKMKPRLEKLSHTNELYGRTAESLIAEMKNDGILTTMVEHGEAKLIFLHRTFQEYLAARGLAKQENWLELALTHVYDSWWQEVLWLLGGVLEKQHPTEYVVALLQENRKDLLVRPLQLAVGAGCEARWDRLPSGLSGGLLKVALDLYLYAAPGIARERWLLLIECWAGQALRKLLALLQHHEPEVQRAVLKALGRMGLAEVPALLRQLDADIQETAARAAEALGRIGSVEAVPALLRCLDGSMELAGAEALRRITQLNKMPLVPERATKNLRNWLDSLAHALEAVEADARRQ